MPNPRFHRPSPPISLHGTATGRRPSEPVRQYVPPPRTTMACVQCGAFSSARTCHACSTAPAGSYAGHDAAEATERRVFVQANYAQIEMRIAAQLAAEFPRPVEPDPTTPGTAERFWTLMGEQGILLGLEDQARVYRVLQRFLGEQHEYLQANDQERLRAAMQSLVDLGQQTIATLREEVKRQLPPEPPTPRISSWDRLRDLKEGS